MSDCAPSWRVAYWGNSSTARRIRNERLPYVSLGSPASSEDPDVEDRLRRPREDATYGHRHGHDAVNLLAAPLKFGLHVPRRVHLDHHVRDAPRQHRVLRVDELLGYHQPLDLLGGCGHAHVALPELRHRDVLLLECCDDARGPEAVEGHLLELVHLRQLLDPVQDERVVGDFAVGESQVPLPRPSGTEPGPTAPA